MKEILKKIFKQPLWTFGFCMVVVLVFSLFANMAHTSFYQVKVEKITFETETNNGEMEGLLYTPKGCNAENPCPVVVLTHGYLNSKEMQDAPAVEMSKRGYIVLAFDMYDHGGSTWETPGSFSFFMSSMWDAVKYVYDQPYTLKDANGNGMIAVSGHSMGAYSSELAVMQDALATAAQGHRKIAVSLTVGADYRYSSASIINLYGSRSSGMIIGHYDEFFGNPTDGNKNTVSYKDYVETDQGKEFLGNGTNLGEDEEYVAGKIYEFAGGQRVIYTPNETLKFATVSTSYDTGHIIVGQTMEKYDALYQESLNDFTYIYSFLCIAIFPILLVLHLLTKSVTNTFLFSLIFFSFSPNMLLVLVLINNLCKHLYLHIHINLYNLPHHRIHHNKNVVHYGNYKHFLNILVLVDILHTHLQT